MRARRHIVGCSGGKDSTCTFLRLQELYPEIDFEGVITPTGDELPEMIAHWRYIGELTGKPLTVLTSGVSLQGLIRRWNALPNWQQRWCTRKLKIEPFNTFLAEVAPATVYIGLRADEEEREGNLLYGLVEGIEQRFPLREWGWGLQEVWQYLDQRGITIPERTDCARCFFQQLGEWWRLWRDPSRGVRLSRARRGAHRAYVPQP